MSCGRASSDDSDPPIGPGRPVADRARVLQQDAGDRLGQDRQLLNPVRRGPAVDEQGVAASDRRHEQRDGADHQARLHRQLCRADRGHALQQDPGRLVLGPDGAGSRAPGRWPGGRAHPDQWQGRLLSIGADHSQGLGHHAGQRAEVRQTLQFRHRRRQVHLRHTGADGLYLHPA